MKQKVLGIVVSLAALATMSATAAEKERKPDLADASAGAYHGDIISDARGSSQSDIDVTVVRTGKNEVEVTCDCPRFPTRTFKLTRAMDTIQNVGGNEVFLLNLAETPRRLDLTIDDASWSGQRTGPANPQ